MFLTAQPHAHVRFHRAIERRALWLAEDAAREFPNLPLEDALQLVHLYGERGSPKYERAAMRWLERYASLRARRSSNTSRRSRTSFPDAAELAEARLFGAVPSSVPSSNPDPVLMDKSPAIAGLSSLP